MTLIYVSYALLLGLMAVTGWRYLKCALFVGLIIAAPLVYFDTLSKPKLLTDEWRNDEQVKVVSVTWTEGVAVYYWLLLPEIDEPRYYYEPWNDGSKKRVEQYIEGSEKRQGLLFLNPFEKSLETEKPKTIHPLPQPAFPMKQAPESADEFEA